MFIYWAENLFEAIPKCNSVCKLAFTSIHHYSVTSAHYERHIRGKSGLTFGSRSIDIRGINFFSLKRFSFFVRSLIHSSVLWLWCCLQRMKGPQWVSEREKERNDSKRVRWQSQHIVPFSFSQTDRYSRTRSDYLIAVMHIIRVKRKKTNNCTTKRRGKKACTQQNAQLNRTENC